MHQGEEEGEEEGRLSGPTLEESHGSRGWRGTYVASEMAEGRWKVFIAGDGR